MGKNINTVEKLQNFAAEVTSGILGLHGLLDQVDGIGFVISDYVASVYQTGYHSYEMHLGEAILEENDDVILDYVCHEIRHIVQYETKKLIEMPVVFYFAADFLPSRAFEWFYSRLSHYCLWNGMIYRTEDWEVDTAEYLYSPWEIDARGYSQAYAQEWTEIVTLFNRGIREGQETFNYIKGELYTYVPTEE